MPPSRHLVKFRVLNTIKIVKANKKALVKAISNCGELEIQTEHLLLDKLNRKMAESLGFEIRGVYKTKNYILRLCFETFRMNTNEHE